MTSQITTEGLLINKRVLGRPQRIISYRQPLPMSSLPLTTVLGRSSPSLRYNRIVSNTETGDYRASGRPLKIYSLVIKDTKSAGYFHHQPFTASPVIASPLSSAV